jgi:hypothetical protein
MIAIARDFRVSPDAKQVGRGGEQRHVPSRDARADGLPERRARAWMGHRTRTPDNDQVCSSFKFPTAHVEHATVHADTESTTFGRL